MTNTIASNATSTTLQRQLSIGWSFARDFIIDHVDRDLALWKPAPDSPTVHETAEGWAADWADEVDDAICSPPTIGWLLWHIEWWWTNTLAGVHGQPEVAAEDYRWSGGTDHLTTLKARWDEVLTTQDMTRPIRWVMPEPQPLGFVASWVNFELTKNLSEINLLTMVQAARNGS